MDDEIPVIAGEGHEAFVGPVVGEQTARLGGQEVIGVAWTDRDVHSVEVADLEGDVVPSLFDPQPLTHRASVQ